MKKVEGNHDGSYLTMLSRNGFYFGLINFVVNFSTVFIGQSYWKNAIAATPTACWKGYLLAGIFQIWLTDRVGDPFCFPLQRHSALPASQCRSQYMMNEVNKGLVHPAVPSHMMGAQGSPLFLITLFMEMNSSGASEQIVFSSIIAYDVCRTYIKTYSSGPRVNTLSRTTIIIICILLDVLSIALHELKININFLYKATGVFIGPTVVPGGYSIPWSKPRKRGRCGREWSTFFVYRKRTRSNRFRRGHR